MPNPDLEPSVLAHLRERPYDPARDDYTVPPFDVPLRASKATPVYNMHTYWSKKPHDAIRRYVRHYTQPGDLVLDPFCGAGSTALAALLEGRRAIAVDRSPAATFIAANYCTQVDINKIVAAFAEVMGRVGPEVEWLYATRCDRCGGPATVSYTVYSPISRCPRCHAEVSLLDSSSTRSGERNSARGTQLGLCPRCLEKGVVQQLGRRGEGTPHIPTLVSYLCPNGCRPARGQRRRDDLDPAKRRYFEAHDLGKLREIAALEVPHWYPRTPFPLGLITRQPVVEGAASVDALWTKRNLWAIAAYRDAAMAYPREIRDALLFILTSCAYNVSRMVRYSNTQYLPGCYYLPPVSKEVNALASLKAKFANFLALQRYLAEASVSRDLVVSTQSAQRLGGIPSDTVDYVFTDPPYSGKVQYAEANFGWEQWLGFSTDWWEEEVIVNEKRGKSDADWRRALLECFREVYRVLKPGRWVTLCFHEGSGSRWSAIRDVMVGAGFFPDDLDRALYVEYNQLSFKQYTTDTVVKRDLVVNFRKPRRGEVVNWQGWRDGADEAALVQRALAAIADFLGVHPGATKDRVYDEVVSRLVRVGRLPERGFLDLLAEVGEPVRESVPSTGGRRQGGSGGRTLLRWYLKGTEPSDVPQQPGDADHTESRGDPNGSS